MSEWIPFTGWSRRFRYLHGIISLCNLGHTYTISVYIYIKLRIVYKPPTYARETMHKVLALLS